MFTIALLILCALVIFIGLCITPWQAWLFGGAFGLVAYLMAKGFKQNNKHRHG